MEIYLLYDLKPVEDFQDLLFSVRSADSLNKVVALDDFIDEYIFPAVSSLNHCLVGIVDS